MAKRSGSRSSRSERRAGRDRAKRAKDHGLPERPQPPLRVRAATPEPLSDSGEDRSSDAPLAPATKPSAVPSWVWVAGGALALLVGAYVLSQKRDEALNETKPEPETPAASASAALESTEPTPEPSAAEPNPSVQAPAEPAPAITEPEKPRVEKPAVAKPRAPVVPKPATPAAAPAAPVPEPAPAKPADNPY